MLSPLSAAVRTAQLPAGVELVSVASCRDARGSLVALERHSPMPFSPVRTFVIRDVPCGQVRARHALSCHELLWLLTGSCVATVHDGRTSSTIYLKADAHALVIAAGVWIELAEFARGTILMVLASKTYAETETFAEPQPALIAAHAKRS